MLLVEISKTKIDRFGDRLRKGNVTDDDLRLLDEYRRSFGNAYDSVVGTIRQQLKLEPTGRPAKSTTSIAEKLRRESIRLTQIQDIAGCRLVVSDIAEQERVKSALVGIFPGCVMVDRRQRPSHGYRAVHVIAAAEDNVVEIQLRTALQQAWAELSEKLSDLIDPAIKYGGGDNDLRDLLSETSLTVAVQEANESMLLELQRNADKMLDDSSLTEEVRVVIMDLQAKIAPINRDVAETRDRVLRMLRRAIERVEGK